MVVVDDSTAARTAIECAVSYAEEFELVAAAASGEEALEIVPRVDPDLILLDFRMSGLDGLETSRLLRARGARALIVLVSAFGRPELPDYVESSGVAAFLHKSEVSPRRLSRMWEELQSGRLLGAPATQ